jgi:hypothetical protein
MAHARTAAFEKDRSALHDPRYLVRIRIEHGTSDMLMVPMSVVPLQLEVV